jgi:hypothetical protein
MTWFTLSAISPGVTPKINHMRAHGTTIPRKPCSEEIASKKLENMLQTFYWKMSNMYCHMGTPLEVHPP